MVLTVKERNQLTVLKEKEKTFPDPLTDGEREGIENRIKDTFTSMPTIMTELMSPWNKYCEILQNVATDNSRLLGEIDRLIDAEKKG